MQPADFQGIFSFSCKLTPLLSYLPHLRYLKFQGQLFSCKLLFFVLQCVNIPLQTCCCGKLVPVHKDKNEGQQLLELIKNKSVIQSFIKTDYLQRIFSLLLGLPLTMSWWSALRLERGGDPSIDHRCKIESIELYRVWRNWLIQSHTTFPSKNVVTFKRGSVVWRAKLRLVAIVKHRLRNVLATQGVGQDIFLSCPAFPACVGFRVS